MVAELLVDYASWEVNMGIHQLAKANFTTVTAGLEFGVILKYDIYEKSMRKSILEVSLFG